MSTGSSRPTIGGLLMVVGLLIVSSLMVVSCGSGGSSSNGTGGNGPGGNGSCDISVGSEDCDNDSRTNNADNCPTVANTDQNDGDSDGVGDVCDVDDDNDGLVEIYDSAMLWAVHCDPDGTSYTAPMTDADGAVMLGSNGYPQCGTTANRNGALATKTPTDTTDCTAETAPDSGIYLCGYELGGDIDFPADWISLRDRDVGTSRNGSFSGIFEGNGYELNNLAYVSHGTEGSGLKQPVGGLFDGVEVTSTIIRNLAISGTLTAGSVDGIVGSTGGIAGFLAGTMIAVGSRATINDINIDISPSSGGLVGTTGGAIYSSFASGMLTAADKTFNSRLGGLVGTIIGSDATVDNSYVGGSVQGSPQDDVIGGLSGSSGPTTTNSYASATIDGGAGADFAGGLVGTLVPTVTNSYYDDAKVTVVTAGDDADTKNTTGTAVSDAQLRGCKQAAPIDTTNDPGGCANLYVGWSDTFWDFGARMQLPVLKYAQITAVAGSDCSEPGGAAIDSLPFRPNALAQPYCGKLQRGQTR